jgi:predicted component of type VI protein secretion system
VRKESGTNQGAQKISVRAKIQIRRMYRQWIGQFQFGSPSKVNDLHQKREPGM